MIKIKYGIAQNDNQIIRSMCILVSLFLIFTSADYHFRFEKHQYKYYNKMFDKA